MNLLSSILLLSAVACPLLLSGQNTGAQATPQTKNATPAGASAAPNAATQPSGQTRRSGATAAHSTQRRGKVHAHSTRGSAEPSASPAPAANSSITVIGGSKLNPSSASAEAVALPGVGMPHNAFGIAAGTPIHLRLQQTVDSGHARNGDTLQGALTEPLGSLSAGSPVTLTVVAVAPAGDVGSSGVLSLQVIRVNGEQLLSQVITAEGKQGPALTPDAAPARGTEAVFAADTPFTVPAA